MSTDIMCNGHRFVKSTLFHSPGYLADLSPYINAVISSRLLATPINLTASAIKPLAPLAQSILPARATSFILTGTLTCEYCLHQVSQDAFDDGRPCPVLLLERLELPETEFVLADHLLEAQERLRNAERNNFHEQSNTSDTQTQSDDPTPSTSGSSRKDDSSSICNQIRPKTPTQLTEPSTSNQSLEVQLQRQRTESSYYKNDLLIMKICPEIGLHAQAFSCVDCETVITLNIARLCHYDGRYYCHSCHTGSDLLPIPARVLRNWDFTPKPVSKSSLHKICFLRTKPILFNLFQINSMLYGFIDRLVDIKQIRERIQSMLKYIEVCGQNDKPFMISIPKHFLKESLINFFTLNDLYDIDQVYDLLSQLQSTLEMHIVRKCESCRGKGFYCELCKDPRDILYPFSRNGAICAKCHTVFHKNCFHRKKKNCPRCLRLDTKRSSLSTFESSNSLDVSDSDENDESVQ